MADILSITLRTYQRLENEGSLPNEKTLQKMAARLGVFETELFQPKKADSADESEIRYILEILLSANEFERRAILAAAKSIEPLIHARTGKLRAR